MEWKIPPLGVIKNKKIQNEQKPMKILPEKKEILSCFGKTIRNRRKKLGLSINTFKKLMEARLKSISLAYINKVELHGEIPSVEMILHMADVLELDGADLIELAKEGKRQQLEKSLSLKYPKI